MREMPPNSEKKKPLSLSLNHLFMSYLHGSLSHSWQPVLLLGMSDHKAPASKVRRSSVDNRNTTSGSGGEGKKKNVLLMPPSSSQRATLQVMPVTVSHLLAAPEVSQDTFVMCDQELNQVGFH